MQNNQNIILPPPSNPIIVSSQYGTKQDYYVI